MIAFLGAMEGEIRAVADALENKKTEPCKISSIYTGTLAGKELVVAATGVGKAMAAMTAQKIIDRFSPKWILFFGIAGGIDANLKPGDLVLAPICMQWDMDTTTFGFKRGEIPNSPFSNLPCAKNLLAAARSFAPNNGTVHSGNLASGDTFVRAEMGETIKMLQQDLKVMAVDMEAAAVGLACVANQVPFLAAKVISDMVEKSLPGGIKKIIKNASETGLKLLLHLLERV